MRSSLYLSGDWRYRRDRPQHRRRPESGRITRTTNHVKMPDAEVSCRYSMAHCKSRQTSSVAVPNVLANALASFDSFLQAICVMAFALTLQLVTTWAPVQKQKNGPTETNAIVMMTAFRFYGGFYMCTWLPCAPATGLLKTRVEDRWALHGETLRT